MYQEVGRTFFVCPEFQYPQYPISLPEPPSMNDGNGRKENLSASYLLLVGNAGWPKQVIGQGARLQRLRPVW